MGAPRPNPRPNFRRTDMSARFLISAIAAVATLLSGCATAPEPSAAERRLGVPESADERQYLGLLGDAPTFELQGIHCEVLVIDCFDMYCHICQSGAKHVNELYRLTQERGLGASVKFVGLGLGDTPLEVSTYKEKFKVPFPVFPDRRSAVARQFGPVKLPNLIILRKQGDGLEVIHTSSGPLLHPSEVMDQIQSTLKQERSNHWEDAAQASQPTCGDDCPRNAALPAAPGRSKASTPD